jgi:glutamyl-tRNA synthetase
MEKFMEKVIAYLLENTFTQDLKTLDQLEALYPEREMIGDQKQTVTRFAPSPTGFLHIGSVLTSLIAQKIAKQANGKFVLRIEDTDTKREVEGATDIIIKGLKSYDINIDEGVTENGEIGSYGPYKQSQRGDIYLSCIMHLLKEGKAYLCFCSSEKLEAQRTQQKASSQRTGYYGQWARCRNLSEDEVLAKLENNEPFVIRLKSDGNPDHKITVKDLIRGKTILPENDDDIVILKGDGLPTYHFAHVVDDHFMRTTHVTRGDEWVSSLALHIQLFKTMGWKAPKYAHIAPIQKMDDGSRRKLSKRKDPEANVLYYHEVGYPKQAVIDYLLNLINANFEDWRKNNLNSSIDEFELTFAAMKKSGGALLDFVKLDNVSKNIIATMSAEEIFELAQVWAKDYDEKLFKVIQEQPEYVKSILGIERTNAAKVRKDISKWSEIYSNIKFFFDDEFAMSIDKVCELVPNIDKEFIVNILDNYKSTYSEKADKQEWFDDVKQKSENFKFAANKKVYKEDPESFIGDISDYVKILRCALTGSTQSPDLYEIMLVLGKDKTIERLNLN